MVTGHFGERCRIIVRKGVEFLQRSDHIEGSAWAGGIKDDITLVFLDVPRTHLIFHRSGSHMIFCRNVRRFHAVVIDWGNSSLFVGEDTCSGGIRIDLFSSDVVIGKECLFSNEILIQSHDGHGIVDLATMEIVNQGRGRIELGPRAWVGRRAAILKNVTIGPGAIVGSSSVVTKDIAPFSLAAGVPAKTIREGVSWCLDRFEISDAEREFYDSYRTATPYDE